MTATVVYKGDLECESTHLYSSTTIKTDAPQDNMGKGSAFSPTDLVATATANCMLTIMGIKARENNWDIRGTRADVVKVMASNPRRISALHITIHMPKAFMADEKTRSILENVARTCPVIMSLHPDIEKDIHFVWNSI
jgi:uncharacterized OsmC-like protein